MAIIKTSGGDDIVNEKRREDNLETWKECLKNYLIGQGLWGVVSGDEPKPEEIDRNYKDWMKKNALALHAIQISCEEDTISHLMRRFPNIDSAKCMWDNLADMQSEVTSYKEEATSSILEYSSLHMAVEQGDLNTVMGLLKRNPNDLRAKITVIGQTALHVAVLAEREKIVEELVKFMSKEDLEMKTNFGNTAFALAALNGMIDMAKVMLKKNQDLVTIKNDYNGQIPLVTASLYGQQEMIRYLSEHTPIHFLQPRTNDKNGATQLNCLITNEMYDEALDLLKKYPQLGYTQDFHNNYAIKLLANEPSAFLSGSKLEFWKQWIYSFPKSIKDLKLKHAKALQLLKVIVKEIPTLSNEQLKNIGLDQVIYDAIKCGSFEFINELITCNPVIIWRADKRGRTLFAHAVTLRQEKIFNLIYGLGAKRRTFVIQSDVFRNNYLHLAAKLSPSFQLDRVPGAALQMQRELQWYKEIESMVPPKFGERLNENGLTPVALFTKEHRELVKEGERWMKNNTASCMVVAALIATVMFTTAFTVPGGNDKKGFPIFLGYDAFLVFIVSNALSLFSSSTSVLIFLGILTARFAEIDFLESLPKKLILGLFTLFFSVVTMMIAFGSTLFIILEKRLSWIAIPVTILSIIPIVFFVFYQFPLLIQMVKNTHKRSIFDKPKKS
ncbi:ankyrin repeat-containing protein ITN1-like [Hevea brasiliensis]|uniref:ankyrin repeat-containing protein ITN1-like n=1 Tax=Hevea brasiliensis TaxID=3981 RepID=UPI0025D389B6|nr:ankyrin repeat-containing protein ITN1-like [Hevea brasiliensis]